MAANGKQLDTSIEVCTPENISFRYRLAGPFRRLPAYLIDVAIRAAVMFVIYLVVILAIAAGLLTRSMAAPGVVIGAAYIAWFVLEWFYGGLFEAFWNGQTPGKRLLGIRVLSTDGQPISAWQAVLRNILRVADGMPPLFIVPGQPIPLYQFGLWSTAFSARFQRLGDLACGTMVVVEERRVLRGLVAVAQPEVLRLAALIPANYRASRSMGLAVAIYVERRWAFSWGRRQEIAQHLGVPLRQKFGLPKNTDLDLLLCALYQRTFVADRAEQPAETGSPFAPAGQLVSRAGSTSLPDFFPQQPLARSPRPRAELPEVLSFLDEVRR